jgi:hypothetical protein
MRHIASTTLSTSAGSIVMSNIPQTFSHLQVRVWARSPDTGTIGFMNFGLNADFYSTNYSQHALGGNGSSVFNEANANAGGFAGLYIPGASTTADCFSFTIIDVLDYTNTSKFKTMKSLHGLDLNQTSPWTGHVIQGSALWRSTAAVDTVRVFNSNFAAGSRVDVYGLASSTQTGA